MGDKIGNITELGEIEPDEWPAYSTKIIVGSRRQEELMNFTRRFRMRSHYQEKKREHQIDEEIREMAELTKFEREQRFDRLRELAEKRKAEDASVEEIEALAGYAIGAIAVTVVAAVVCAGIRALLP